MGKKNTPKQPAAEHEVDIFKDLTEDDSVDVLITTEESLVVTLFDDETHAETDGDEEDDFDSIFTHKKKKVINPDEEDSDFDSYFFEE